MSTPSGCVADSSDSFGLLIAEFRAGCPAAANELTRRYFVRVVRAAERRLAAAPLRGGGAEDIAASVFESLWARAAAGDYRDGIADADELWRLLCKMTSNKAADHIRRERAAKRGGGRVRGESAFAGPGGAAGPGIGGVAGRGFTPEELADFAERHARLMALLPHEILREVATLRLEGFEVEEIAERLAMSSRTVKRKLASVRDAWSAEAGERRPVNRFDVET